VPPNRLYVSVLIVLVTLIYGPTIGYDFVNIDDPGLIFSNPIVTNGRNSYWAAFEKFLFTAYYKPLVFLTWRIEYQLLGKGAWHFHLFNAVLHLLNSILVLKLGRHLFQRLFTDSKKTEWFAFLWALLFAVHPFRIESVAWATERKDVLFAFFFLLSWLSYIRFVKNGQYRWMIFGAILYLFGGLSKSMAITLPAVLLLTDFWLGRPLDLRSLFKKLPYGISFLLLLILFGFIKPFPQTQPVDSGASAPLAQYRMAAPNEQITTIPYIREQPLPVQQVVTTSMRIFLWAGRNFFPYPLSINYPNNRYYGLLGRGIFLTPFILLILFVISIAKRRSHPEYFFTYSFFLLTLIPVLIITTSGQAIFLSDRYMYMPSLGLFFLILTVFAKWQADRRRINFIFLLLAAGYFLYSLLQVGVWKNSGTLFRQALKVHPGSGMALLNLGLYYTEQKESDKAFKVYSDAIAQNTSYVQIYHNRARILLDRGEVDSALTDLNKCLSLDPGLPYALLTRAEAYYLLGKSDSALIDLKKALVLDSTMQHALYLRSLIRYEMKDYALSLSDAKDAIAGKRPSAGMYNLIALAHYRLGQTENALQALDSAIHYNEKQGGYWFNQSLILRSLPGNDSSTTALSKARQLGYTSDSLFIERFRK
jgi:tetratricopeptide (TPR) repeat protein